MKNRITECYYNTGLYLETIKIFTLLLFSAIIKEKTKECENLYEPNDHIFDFRQRCRIYH